MCAVSAVFDYYGQRPDIQWTRPDFDEFKEIIRRLDGLDAKLDQPDCIDPAKAAWMQAVEERLAKLESEDDGSTHDEMVP